MIQLRTWECWTLTRIHSDPILDNQTMAESLSGPRSNQVHIEQRASSGMTGSGSRIVVGAKTHSQTGICIAMEESCPGIIERSSKTATKKISEAESELITRAKVNRRNEGLQIGRLNSHVLACCSRRVWCMEKVARSHLDNVSATDMKLQVKSLDPTT